MRKCSQCNTNVDKGDLFCNDCGAKLESSRVKEMLLILAVLGGIFAAMWLIWLAVATINISWLYNGFQYPSIVIALITIVYGFVYASKVNTETTPCFGIGPTFSMTTRLFLSVFLMVLNHSAKACAFIWFLFT